MFYEPADLESARLFKGTKVKVRDKQDSDQGSLWAAGKVTDVHIAQPETNSARTFLFTIAGKLVVQILAFSPDLFDA